VRGFNPRPALLPGDASSTTAEVHLQFGFNPRPALLPGDAPRLQTLSDHSHSLR
jgi:hypothetical protein